MCGCGTVTRKTEISTLEKAREGDTLAFRELFEPLKFYRDSLCRRFFLPGAEREDIEQEAMLGFAQAINDFEEERGIAFQDFAMLKMRNSVVASVRKATRKKQQILSDASTLEPAITPVSDAAQPDAVAMNRCFLHDLFGKLKENLSSLELTALLHRAEGVTVKEIADLLSIGEKTVENALFRARKKAKQASLAMAC